MKTNLLKKIKSFDFFGHGVSFLVDGSDKSRSYCGAIVSLLSSMLTGAYFVYMLQIMVRYQNSSVTYNLNKNVFTDSEIIQTAEERLGFNIAFGIIDISTYKAVEEIEAIGSFKAEFMSFNSESFDLVETPVHRCTQEDKKKFYNPNEVF